MTDKAAIFKKVNLEKNQVKSNKNLNLPVEVVKGRAGSFSPASAAPIKSNPLTDAGDVQRLASLNPKKIKSIIKKQI